MYLKLHIFTQLLDIFVDLLFSYMFFDDLPPGADEKEKDKETVPSTTNSAVNNPFPYAKKLSELQVQSVPPITHFVYAVTW